MYHPTRATGAGPVKIERARQLRRDMTPEEGILWQALRTFRSRGYTFRRQQVIAGFIADFYCYQASLVVEVDGGVHAEQAEYDAERDTVIAAYGLRILRVSNHEVREHLDDVVARIGEACWGPHPQPLSLRGEGSQSARPAAPLRDEGNPDRDKGPRPAVRTSLMPTPSPARPEDNAACSPSPRRERGLGGEDL
jgi:very-short-patch-repair endonuclease